jgi:thiaminase/transcriptional activator TenA
MNGLVSERWRCDLDSIWEAQHQHPFVRGLGDGSLELARFETWLRQDYLRLIELARLLSVGAVRADIETMKWMIARAHGVLHHELLLHQAYAIEFGIPAEELPRGVKLPTTRAYTNHLLRTASLGEQLELVATLLPALWGRAEIAQRLAKLSAPSRYARWIDLYSGPVADGLARQGRELLDRLVKGAGEEHLARALDAFATSSRYEWMFWEMCDQGERWPI